MPVVSATDLAKALPSLGSQGVDYDDLANQANAALAGTLGRKALCGETVVENFRFDEFAGDYLTTNEYPILNVTSIKFDDVSQTLTDFVWGKTRRFLKKKSGIFPLNKDIEITYTAGYADGSSDRAALKAGAIGIAKDIAKVATEATQTVTKLKYRDYEVEYSTAEGDAGKYPDPVERLIGEYRRRPEL